MEARSFRRKMEESGKKTYDIVAGANTCPESLSFSSVWCNLQRRSMAIGVDEGVRSELPRRGTVMPLSWASNCETEAYVVCV